MFFQNITEDIRECVVTKHSWESTDYTLRLTGIPQHVGLIVETEQLKRKLDSIHINIRTDIDYVID